MVGKSGFIRDPSGLLMSVIRTLEDHTDERHRDLEREKLEEAYSDIDQNLDNAVEGNFKEIKSTIERFGEIGSGIRTCRSRMAEVKEKLVQCKQLLHCRQDELRSLWVEGIEYKKTMELLDFVNSIRDTPAEVEKMVSENNFLGAAEKVQKALHWCQEDLGEVGALQDLRHEIQAKHQSLYSRLIMELQKLVYSHHSDDETIIQDNLSKMEQFAKALEILEKTDDGIDEIQNQIDTEISSIVNRETTKVSDRSFSETDIKPENQLLILLENLIFQFRNVAKMHQRLLTSVKTSNYKTEEVWFKIQNILKLLLRDYLEEDNQRSFTSFGTDLPRSKRKMKLFRFDASTHAISMNTYLREKRQETGASAGHQYFSAHQVCKTSARNITKIYRPLMNFIEEIEQEVGQDSIDLRHYVNDHIQKTFIHQVKADLRMELDNATKVTDPLKVIADSTQQKLMYAPSPILQSAMVVCKSVEELVDVLTELDGYRETFFSLICVVLQEFQRSIQESFQNLIHEEDDNVEITSTNLIAIKDLKQMIKSSPSWRKAFGINYKHDQNESEHIKLHQEAEMVTKHLLDKQVTKHNIIEDSSDIKALANLHESLEWLTMRLRKTFGRLTAEMNAESNILINLNNILQKFQASAEQCLIYLHMEQRTRCFLYLGNMFKGARFDVKNSMALETDPEVVKLEHEFRHIEEVLSANLQTKKYRFVFEGLGHQLGSLLMEGCRLMTRISPAGVKKICRNIFTLQQALTNITMNREPALDQARQYYELLYQRPDELVNTVEESGPKYSLDAYLVALSLAYKSMGDINIGDQTRHRQLTNRLTEVCQSQANIKSVNIDDYDF